MRVFIDKEVHQQIEAFYGAAMEHHIALDEATVIKKIDKDFHFAYKIYTMDNGERIVWIHDAVHSLLYH